MPSTATFHTFCFQKSKHVINKIAFKPDGSQFVKSMMAYKCLPDNEILIRQFKLLSRLIWDGRHTISTSGKGSYRDYRSEAPLTHLDMYFKFKAM